MKKIVTGCICLFAIFAGYSQQKTNQFRMVLANNSGYTITCTIFGNDKTDSVPAGKTKSIVFNLAPDLLSFFLALSTSDHSDASFRDKVIKILNSPGLRSFTVTKQSQLQYTATPSEKIVADYNPQLRSKNFWKLDTIVQRYADDISAAEIVYVSVCDIDVPVDTIKRFYNFLSPNIQSSPFGRRIQNYLVARSRLNTGNTFANFTLKNKEGKNINLYSIHSDYILIDFWFSRCAPCIKSFPELKNIYSKASRNKFEIIGISIDEAAEADLWKSTIDKHSLPWVNLNDPKAALAAKYAIVNYPTKVLLDKNKKIVLADTNNGNENFYSEVEKLVNQ